MEYFLPYQKTGMTQSSATPALQCELVSPKGTQKGEESLPSNCHETAATPYSGGFPGDPVVKKLTLAPHERLPEILVVPREKTPTGAAARGLLCSRVGCIYIYNCYIFFLD